MELNIHLAPLSPWSPGLLCAENIRKQRISTQFDLSWKEHAKLLGRLLWGRLLFILKYIYIYIDLLKYFVYA